MLKKITKTKKAGRQERGHRPSRPTPREKQRKQPPPTSPPTRSNQDDRRARKRSGDKRRRPDPSGKAPRTRGHATPPARTNRKRATTRTHEPRQQPRGTGKDQRSRNQPRDKDTKNKSAPDTTQPRKKPPQPRKKPPQPQKRSTAKEQKTSTEGDHDRPRTSRPEHPLYLKFRDPHDKNRTRRRMTAQARPRAGGALGGALSLDCGLGERPDLSPPTGPCGLAENRLSFNGVFVRRLVCWGPV